MPTETSTGSPSSRDRVATYEDVLAAPEHMTAEVIDGVLHVQPRPARPHTRVASRLAGFINATFDLGVGGPGGWVIDIGPEIHLGRDILVPDLAGWRIASVPDPSILTQNRVHRARARLGRRGALTADRTHRPALQDADLRP